MSRLRRIIFFVAEGFELLDVAGPTSVFAAAGEVAGEALYDSLLVSPGGGRVRAATGIAVAATEVERLSCDADDTLLLAGAGGRIPSMRQLGGGFLLLAAGAGRIGSLSTGAFLLAETGLLSGRRATTHWAQGKELAASYPDVEVDCRELYIEDGGMWTAAGGVAGIDMALAMLAADHGSGLAAQVARLVNASTARPGGQAPFSRLTPERRPESEEFAELVIWLRQQLGEPVKTSDMAAFMDLPERSFHRHFLKQFGTTPGQYLDDLRMERARNMLEAGWQLKQVLDLVGYRSPSAFRTAFKARFGVSPGHVARMAGHEV